jgi:hypothetical protein
MVALIALSAVTGFIFAAVATVVFACWLTEPPSFPGDPNIGAGLLGMAALLNVPVLAAWGIWIASRFGGQ